MKVFTTLNPCQPSRTVQQSIKQVNFKTGMKGTTILRLLVLGCVGIAIYNYTLTPKVSSDQPTPQHLDEEPSTLEQPSSPPVKVKMSKFVKTILTAGNGPTPKPKQYVTVAADLYLADAQGGKGTAIWSTHKSSGFLFAASSGPQPFEYQAGVGGVVPGWEDGVASMQLGEAARLNIPWQYAYGAAGHPGFKIPPKADLVFEITVLAIK